VLALLKLTGDWGMFKGEKGAKSTVRFAEPKTPFVVDEKKKPVLKPKTEKPAVVEAAVVEAAAVEAPAAEADAAPADAAPAADDADAAAEPTEAEKA
jgi:small subunit ribosomal protein S16